MNKENKIGLFVDKISSIHKRNVFNPYSETCSLYDLDGASEIRKDILYKLILAASLKDVESLWIGRDLGHRGGRRTGLALTDETQISLVSKLWDIDIPRCTTGRPVSEVTASVVWDMLSRINKNIFLWNVFPFHPYCEKHPYTNRAHNAEERVIGEELLQDLVGIIKPKNIVAIGNDAYNSANKIFMNLEVVKFRHPSYGGKNIFISQVCDYYQVKIEGGQKDLF